MTVQIFGDMWKVQRNKMVTDYRVLSKNTSSTSILKLYNISVIVWRRIRYSSKHHPTRLVVPTTSLSHRHIKARFDLELNTCPACSDKTFLRLSPPDNTRNILLSSLRKSEPLNNP